MNFRTMAESSWFNQAALWVVVVNAVLIGVETYVPGSPMIGALLTACLGLFMVEIAVRFLGRASTGAFFRDGWNIFDLVIIIAAFVPATGPLAPIVRVLRVFRVFRLVRSIPELRMIVTVLGRSIVSMKWIGLLAVICFYVFAIIGVKLFGAAQPAQFGTLHESVFTLFRILTQDDWSDLRYEAIQSKGWIWPTVFHVSWIVLATFILINLVVGAIINNYQEVQQIERSRKAEGDATDERIAELAAELNRLIQARKIREENRDSA